MKGRQVVTSVVVLGLLVGLAGVTLAQGTAPQGAPVGTAFTYQGRLEDGSGAVTGTCDFTFRLYDAPGSGSPPAGGTLAGTDPVAGVAVVDGYFTAELDFGAGAFPGEARWLEIEVNCGAGSVILSPRQALTATPYALWAAEAGGAPWAGLTGVPGGLADGLDADALGGLACAKGEMPVWNGAGWACGRSEATTYSNGTGLWLSDARFSLAKTYRMPQTCTDGQVAEWDVTEEVWTCAPDDDALGGLACADGEVAQWDDVGGAWTCAADDDSDTTYSAGNRLNLVGTTFHVQEGAGSDLDADLLDGEEGTFYRDWANLTGVPAGFGDGVDNALDADADPTNELEMPTGCGPGQIVEWDAAGGAWTCAEDDDGDTTYTAGNQLNLVGTTFHVQEGAGSGLNADLLDGQHGTDYHDWANLTGVPAGFADGVDNVNDADADATNELEMPTGCDPDQMAAWDDTAGEWKCAAAAGGDITAVYTGVGLSGGGASGAVTLNVDLAGSGTAATVARSDHQHDTRYYTQVELGGDGTAQVHWSNLTNMPSGFADGEDDDTLGGLACGSGEVAKWNGGAWACQPDEGGTAYAAGKGLDLSDTKFSLEASYRLPQGCSVGDMAVWGGADWVCGGPETETPETPVPETETPQTPVPETETSETPPVPETEIPETPPIPETTPSPEITPPTPETTPSLETTPPTPETTPSPETTPHTSQKPAAPGPLSNAVLNPRGSVWADLDDDDFDTPGDHNSSWVRATEGVGFVTTLKANGEPGFVCWLSPGSSWRCSSDRQLKENLTLVDGGEVLTQLSQVPIYTWNARGLDPAIPHMGPMAQDFYAAFGLGEDDRHLATIDLDGVALAAIQGLYTQNQELSAENAALRAEHAVQQTQLDDLVGRLAALEALLAARAQDGTGGGP